MVQHSQNNGVVMAIIKISASQPVWCCDIYHTPQVVTYADGLLSDAQIAELQAHPLLTVEIDGVVSAESKPVNGDNEPEGKDKGKS